MKNDDFGDRMKLYESFETNRRTKPLLPVLARLDGKTFSKFTKGLKRPFDKRFADLMIEVTEYLITETNACIGYTQSDEITLGWHSDSFNSQIYFNGKIFKMTSTLSAMASVKFNQLIPKYLPEKISNNTLPIFDCRVWELPNLIEGANAFLWRERDAIKNSILNAGHLFLTKSQTFKKSTREIKEMLLQKGIDWNDYPDFFKYGTYIQKRKVMTKFTESEIEKLPLKHEARKNPNLKILRQKLFKLDIKKFEDILNRENIIFKGAQLQ